MLKLLWAILTLSLALNAEYQAKTITNAEFKQIQNIDKKLYDLNTRINHFNFAEIAHYIVKNLVYDLDFTHLKITSFGTLRTSSSETTYTENELITDRNTYNMGIKLTYPLFDQKEVNERKKQILVLKQKIIGEIKTYAKLKAKVSDLNIDVLVLKELEIRTKARKLNGVGGFNDWYNVLKDIKKSNYDLEIATIELKEQQQILESYVLKNKQKKLKAML